MNPVRHFLERLQCRRFSLLGGYPPDLVWPPGLDEKVFQRCSGLQIRSLAFNFIDASPFWVGTPQIWYGRWVLAKGLSKGTPDFEPGPNLPILIEAGPNSKAFDASSAGPASVKI
jgi:hypothetical protein